MSDKGSHPPPHPHPPPPPPQKQEGFKTVHFRDSAHSGGVCFARASNKGGGAGPTGPHPTHMKPRRRGACSLLASSGGQPAGVCLIPGGRQEKGQPGMDRGCSRWAMGREETSGWCEACTGKTKVYTCNGSEGETVCGGYSLGQVGGHGLDDVIIHEVL